MPAYARCPLPLALLSLLAASAACAQPQPETNPPRPPTREELARYPWLSSEALIRPLEEALAPPPGYTRIPVEAGSFGAWLRRLPLRPAGSPVRDYQGGLLRTATDSRIAAVAELDVGSVDLQQCADSILRLHAEWLWASGRTEHLSYRLTSGDPAPWARYAAGERLRVSGRKVSWVQAAGPDSSRKAFRHWLDIVFTYAGTLSLAAERSHPSREQLKPGDLFVLGGSPGHAVLVLDMARNSAGERVALIGQGFTPAQDFHVLSPGRSGPWFSLEGDTVDTPFWKPFPWSSLRRLGPR